MRDQIAMDARMELTRSASMLTVISGKPRLQLEEGVPQVLMLKKMGLGCPLTRFIPGNAHVEGLSI
jgi:hypothetical protein